MKRTFLMFLVFGLWIASDFAQALPRDKTETARFKKLHPCPATGKSKGACPGHQVDHVEPLMLGGADRPENMQWIKTSDHKHKTKVDLAACKKAPVCLHRRLKKTNRH